MSWNRSSRYNRFVSARLVNIAIGLGSNMGDREALLAMGRDELAKHGVFWTAFSSIYESDPVGPVQEQGPFLNQTAIGETELPPLALWGLCLAAERLAGRERKQHWGPRTLDLDILLYGDAPVNEPGLIVPHRELTRRAFVLTPLAEIAPEWVVPGEDRMVRALAAALPPEGGVRLWQSSAMKRQTLAE